MLMVAAQAMVEQPQLVFQLSSGDLNPLHMDRVVTLPPSTSASASGTRRPGTKSSTSWRSMESAHAGGVRLVFDPRIFSTSRARRPRRSAASGRPGAGRLSTQVDRFRLKKGFDEIDRVTSEAAKNGASLPLFENSYTPGRQHARCGIGCRPTTRRLCWGPGAPGPPRLLAERALSGLERWGAASWTRPTPRG